MKEAVSKQLIDELRQLFPDRCPDVSVPIDEVRALAGEQRVIAALVRAYEEQNENILTGKVLP